MTATVDNTRASSPQRAAASLIRAVEIWLPDADGSLSIDQSFYDETPSFEAASANLTMEAGMGLPGQVYLEKKPVVFREFGGSDFARTEAAELDGLIAGIGVPVVHAGECIAVVVMLFGGGENALGALESWEPVSDRLEVTLGSSFYAGMPRFEMISKYVQFPKESGLPGTVWSELRPKLLTGLATSKAFMRAAGAGAEALSTAVAWPVADHGDRLYSVCVMLSSSKSPLAEVMQVWEPHEEQPLVLTRTDDAIGNPLREACKDNPPVSGDGLLGAIIENNLPRVISNLNERNDPISTAAVKAGLSRVIAIPVFAGEELRGAVALWS